MALLEIDMAKVISELVLTVKVSKTTRARMWLGTRAMGLAARIFGCNVEISTVEDSDYDKLREPLRFGAMGELLGPIPGPRS
jgi:hypothetical protein